MSHKILFFGNERLGTGLSTTAPSLRALVAAGYEITGVVIAQNDLGKSRKERTLEIVQVAEEHGIPVISPANLKDAGDEIAGFGAELGVLVAYGNLVPQGIIDLFPRGIVNIHPSLLPKHRGPIPIESVILNGEFETGVSLMQLAASMDTGPVFTQTSLALNGSETKQALADRLGQAGADMLVKSLPGILDGSLKAAPQNEELATADNKITKADGEIDWNKPAIQLEREVRAYAGWPRSYTQIGNTAVILTRAGLAEGEGTPGSLYMEDNQLGVYTGQGVLIIDSLIPAGKKEMPASAFLAGYSPN
jgi:methionyl-tRNA formyltransferase